MIILKIGKYINVKNLWLLKSTEEMGAHTENNKDEMIFMKADRWLSVLNKPASLITSQKLPESAC